MSALWTKPVFLIGRSGRIHAVATIEEAYTCLTEDWPVSHGPAFLTALDICGKAIDRAEGPDLARHALLEAATEAGVAIQDIGVIDEPDDRPTASQVDIARRIEEDR
jgi:hypothetical protein